VIQSILLGSVIVPLQHLHLHFRKSIEQACYFSPVKNPIKHQVTIQYSTMKQNTSTTMLCKRITSSFAKSTCCLKQTSLTRSFSTVQSKIQFQTQQFGRKPETLEYSQETSESPTTSTFQSESNKPFLTPEKVVHYYMHNHTPLAAQQHLTELQVNHLPKQTTNPKELDTFRVVHSHKPTDFTDRTALTIMRILRVFVHAFFGNRYLHHSVVLETVAAVPGMVSACWRHLTSLRGMKRDHGYIATLIEEAESKLTSSHRF